MTDSVTLSYRYLSCTSLSAYSTHEMAHSLTLRVNISVIFIQKRQKDISKKNNYQEGVWKYMLKQATFFNLHHLLACQYVNHTNFDSFHSHSHNVVGGSKFV